MFLSSNSQGVEDIAMEIVFSNSDRGVINRAKSEGFLGPLQNTKDLFDQTISLGGAFDIGPVNCSPICNQRKQLIRSTFYSDQWTTAENAQVEDRFNDYWTEYNDYYNRIIQFRQNDGTIRVWYSSSPSSLCGLLQMIYLLKDFNCKISVVKLPSYSSTEPIRPLSSWGEIHPEAISKYYVEKKLSLESQTSMIRFWEQLEDENAPLRAIVNGHLISVREDFYDSLINKMIGSTPFRVSRVIVDVMRIYSLGISDFIISERLKSLVRCNALKVIQRNDRFYDSVLQKEQRHL